MNEKLINKIYLLKTHDFIINGIYVINNYDKKYYSAIVYYENLDMNNDYSFHETSQIAKELINHGIELKGKNSKLLWLTKQKN